jgi:signal transduction histidine kinase
MAGSGLRALADRRPIRLRLTLTYSVLFVLAGAMLLAFTYFFVVRGLQPPAGVKTPPALSSALRESCAKAMKAPTPADQNLIGKCETFHAGVTAGAASQRTSAVHQLLLYSLIGLAVIGLVSGLVGWVVAGRALRPVHAITSAARRASEENLGERLALQGPHDELRELGEVFDGMLARLDAAFASQRRFVANASHELRTPLTVMRTAIDVTMAKPERTAAQLEDMAAEVRAAVDRAEALIGALLTLARSDRGVLTREHTDLAVLAEDALDAAAPAIRGRSLRLETELGYAPATGDGVLLDSMVANLVDNAVRHNQEGGWIQVATGMRGGSAYLDVANGGPVLPAGIAPQLFEPFRRASGGEGGCEGAGLGLSIVRSVAAAHAGRAVAASRPAGGLEVSVLLPGDPGAPAPDRAGGEMVAGATDGRE